jgi:hypothetical protein
VITPNWQQPQSPPTNPRGQIGSPWGCGYSTARGGGLGGCVLFPDLDDITWSVHFWKIL